MLMLTVLGIKCYFKTYISMRGRGQKHFQLQDLVSNAYSSALISDILSVRVRIIINLSNRKAKGFLGNGKKERI